MPRGSCWTCDFTPSADRGLRRLTSSLAYFAFCSMNSRRGSTWSPISIEKMRSASSASSTPTWTRIRFSGFIVVSQSSSEFISPRPLKRLTWMPSLARSRIAVAHLLERRRVPRLLAERDHERRQPAISARLRIARREPGVRRRGEQRGGQVDVGRRARLALDHLDPHGRRRSRRRTRARRSRRRARRAPAPPAPATGASVSTRRRVTTNDAGPLP